MALADRLSSGGVYRCLYVNVEAGQAVREDIGATVGAVVSEMASRAREILQDNSVNAIWSAIPERIGPASLLN